MVAMKTTSCSRARNAVEIPVYKEFGYVAKLAVTLITEDVAGSA
jgi:hypothetical protein